MTTKKTTAKKTTKITEKDLEQAFRLGKSAGALEAAVDGMMSDQKKMVADQKKKTCGGSKTWRVFKNFMMISLMTIVALFMFAFIYGMVVGVAQVKSYDQEGLCTTEVEGDAVYECQFRIVGEVE